MARQTFIWTTLPHGFADSGALRVAVFLAPRLTVSPQEGDAAGAPLARFPTWSDWPALLREALPEVEFAVRYRRTADHRPQTLARVRIDPDETALWPEGWQTLFRDAIVQSFSLAPVAERPIRSYPAAALDDEVRQTYARSSATSVVRDSGGVIAASPDAGTPSGPMRDFLDYHQRSAKPADQVAAHEPVAAPPEFHDLLAQLGSFPELFSRFGLIFELRIPRDQFRLFEGEAQLQTTVNRGGRPWPPPCRPGETCDVETVHHSPWTVVDVVTFWPRAGGEAAEVRCETLMQGGLLCPSGDNGGSGSLRVSQIDLEGAALKLASFTPATGSGDGGSLPALRTAGFALIRANQAGIVSTQASQAQANNARLESEEPVLWAQNVNRGYRLDVLEKRNDQWYSLHQRQVAYGLRDQAVHETIAGEGFVQIATTNTGDGMDTTSEVLLLETLARWTGWSLSVPRPLSVIDPALTQGARGNAPLAPIAITIGLPERSLPRLRFGSTYQFRLRVVDLAGNGLSLDEAARVTTEQLLIPAPSWASTPGRPNDHRYLRFEPIGSPLVVPRARHVKGALAPRDSGAAEATRALGDTIDRLLVRGNGRDLSPHAYVAQYPDLAFANQVHLAPPRIAPATAEAHGLFDAAFDLGTDDACAAAFALCQRNGDLPAFAPDPELVLPYLPDPLARGVAVRLLGGPLEQLTRCPYRTDPAWPDLLPFRLETVGTEAFVGPRYDEAARLLTIGVPPGGQVSVALSSFFWQEDGDAFDRELNSLGVWSWLDDLREQVKSGAGSGDITPQSELGRALRAIDDARWPRRNAGEGKFWFLTPPRHLLLVHAVQQPYDAPVIERLAASRDENQTVVALDNDIRIHPESTARLDLTAQWRETLDLPGAPPRWLPPEATGDPAQQQLLVRGAVRDQQILEPREAGEHPYLWAEGVPNPWWQRKETLTLTAEGAIEGPASASPIAVDMTGRRRPISAENTPLLHAFGDTKHRCVDYRLTAASRFADDFVPPAGVDPAHWYARESTAFRVNILSAARPAAPVVRTVMPAFLRRTARSAGRMVRERSGGVRVYVERPWFSSGEEESLAVVLWQGEPWPPAAADPAATLCTRWGRDPIWRRSAENEGFLVPERPSLVQFPLRLETALPSDTLLSVPNGATFGDAFLAAPHRVAFNAERDIWFADIQVALDDAYFPFARLAVARFQPHALANLHLSAAVLTDFVQIPPYRRVEAAVSGDDPDRVQLRVFGRATGQGEGPDGLSLPGSRVSVQVERRVRGADDLGWLPAALPEPPLADAPDAATGILWSGSFRLPPRQQNAEMRFLVLEHDYLATDSEPAGAFAATPRLVFSEALTVDDLGPP